MDRTIFDDWKRTSIRIGAPTILLAIVTSFIPVIWLCITYDVWPETNKILEAWGLLAATSLPFYIVEPISYYNALGMSGTYMSFLAGNIGNMRVPCATMALEATNTKLGTIESEIISTLGIAGSIVTNAFFVLVAALLGTAIVTALPPDLATALSSYAAPAIFGALFGNFAIKNPKLSIVGFVIPIIIGTLLKLPTAVVLLGSVFGTVAVSRFFYVREKKND